MASVGVREGIGLRRGNERCLVLVVDDRVVDFGRAIEAQGAVMSPGLSISNVVSDWSFWEPVIDEATSRLRSEPDLVEGWESIHDVVFDAPVPSDAMLVFTAANYAAHTIEAESSEKVGQQVSTGSNNPYVFLKAMRSVIGPTDDIVKPFDVEQLDWEIELAVMIGREGRRIPAERAMDHVAAYLLCNDVSARDFVRRRDWPMFSSDWFGQKCFDSFTPMGPVLVPASQIPDPDALRLRLWIGDELMQDGFAGEMIFSIPEQISYASRFATLKPGDIISTGTPAGVGMASGRYLKVGEVVTSEIVGLGRQRSRVVAE